MSKKSIILIVALIVSVGCLVGGTTAWLVAQSDEVVNTFTVGNIDITLEETDTNGDGEKSFKMIPGNEIDKDPTVTVKANSEDCWLFVVVTKSGGAITVGNKPYNFDDFIKYGMADGWTQLKDGTDDVPGVFYRTVPNTDTDREFSVLEGDKVTVLDTVTKQMMDALTDDTLPTLTFKAYAVQKANMATAYDAWGEV